MILTKRPENMKEMLPTGWTDGMWKYMPNVWLGVSAENQKRFNERIIPLFQTPATVRFVSAEPLLGPIDFTGTMPVKISHDPRLADDPIEGERIEYHPRIDWIITGGESGPNPRPMNLDWVRDIRDQCIAGEAKFFHKRHGGSKKINGAWRGRELDGRTWDEIPSRT
jgi:protein gp37